MDKSRIILRRGDIGDMPFLERMLYEAFFWDPAVPRHDMRGFLENPEFGKLLAKWGRPGDTAVIAMMGGEPVGAAWYRFWTAENHTYGYISPEIPELGLAVDSQHRSKGIGRTLLRALLDRARGNGVRSISLSVDPRNFALRLYESEGFVTVGKTETSWTMQRDLHVPNILLSDR